MEPHHSLPQLPCRDALIRQYWLARKDKKKVALEPVIDRKNNRVEFRVVEGPNVTGNPAEATTSRGDTRCLLCGQTVKAADVRKQGRQGNLSAVLTAVVLNASGGERGKSYRADTIADASAYARAAERLTVVEEAHTGDLSLAPDEPVTDDPRNIWCYSYGLDEWGKLFNARQLLALTTFARLVGDAHARMLNEGLDPDYAKAVATYLGLAVDRQATRTSTGSFWDAGGETVQQLLARQALPMVWDYVESAPLEEVSGGFLTNIGTVADAVAQQTLASNPATVLARDARVIGDDGHDLVVTDPPYY